MKPFLIKMAEFLNHLENCGGCTGKRRLENCEFALDCASAEYLQKKGMITDSKDLLHYSANFDRSNLLANNIYKSSAGPCTSE